MLTVTQSMTSTMTQSSVCGHSPVYALARSTPDPLLRRWIRRQCSDDCRLNGSLEGPAGTRRIHVSCGIIMRGRGWLTVLLFDNKGGRRSRGRRLSAVKNHARCVRSLQCCRRLAYLEWRRYGCEVLWPACLYVCLSVCPFARVSQKSHVQIPLNFLHMLPVAMARTSSDGNAICYVLPVLWMTYVFT